MTLAPGFLLGGGGIASFRPDPYRDFPRNDGLGGTNNDPPTTGQRNFLAGLLLKFGRGFLYLKEHL